MVEIRELKVEPRAGVGKGAARAIRRKGLIPAVIYGDKKDPQPIAVDYRLLWKEVQTGAFLSTVYVLDVAGQKVQAIPRDIQFDPVRDQPLHVDFLRLAKGARVSVEVPVHFVNEALCPGLKRGGAMNVVRHEIELSCPATDIPEAIEIDISKLDIGDSLHISDVTLPENVTPAITDRDFTILTITGTVGGAEAAEEAEAEDGGEADAGGEGS